MKNRFVGKDGEFVPTVQPIPGHFTVGYLEELCEFLFYHDNMDNKTKLDQILGLESAISEHLKSMNINFIPTWSVKLKDEKI